jgi:hypothetical protein
MLHRNVLFNSLPTRKELRAAVATIVRSLMLEHSLVDEEFGRQIGVSASTVRNARNEDADLGALAIATIGRVFGEDSCQPYAELMGAQLMPRTGSDNNPVPALGQAIAKLSVVSGGKSRKDALPEARAARDALNNFIQRAEAA